MGEESARSKGIWAALLGLGFGLLACGCKTNSCTDNGTVHANGTAWICSDHCDWCNCHNGEIVSTLVACGFDAADAGADVDAGPSEPDTSMVPEASTAPMMVLDSGEDAGPPPSCAAGGPGMTNCGPGGSGTDSCCTSLEVTGGTYFRTYASDTDGGAMGLADPATVSSFRLDTYLVTVGRFRQFVSAWNGGAGWAPPQGSGKHTHLNNGEGLVAVGGGYEPGWVKSDGANIAPTNANLASCSPYTWTNLAGSQENLPINCLSWYEAYAFCIWDGGFLPSDAEWEYAAAGGSRQLEYPWGSASPGTACPGPGCQYAIYGCYYPNGSGNCTDVTSIAPVGTASLGAGTWGQLDLAGDMFEWTLDGYAAYVDPCTDCANLTTSSLRGIRGGSFTGNASYLLPPYRDFNSPACRDLSVGFRCARAP